MATMQLPKTVANPERYLPISVYQWQNGTVATISNKTTSWMTFDRSHNWSGQPALGSFPASILPGSLAHFTHLRHGQFGSVGAVQYSGPNAVGTKCAWIVAWLAPVENEPPCPPNRVYVTCGPKDEMDAISWNQILAKLDMGPTSHNDTDKATKTGVDATIHDSTPDVATLLATFKFVT